MNWNKTDFFNELLFIFNSFNHCSRISVYAVAGQPCGSITFGYDEFLSVNIRKNDGYFVEIISHGSSESEAILDNLEDVTAYLERQFEELNKKYWGVYDL